MCVPFTSLSKQTVQKCWAKTILRRAKRVCFEFSSSDFNFQGHMLSTSGVTLVGTFIKNYPNLTNCTMCWPPKGAIRFWRVGAFPKEGAWDKRKTQFNSPPKAKIKRGFFGFLNSQILKINWKKLPDFYT